MRPLIKLKQAVIVEGKYDKIRLSNILDATIITTDGFGIFKDMQKRQLIKLLAKKCGLVIITDSDHAGQLIRRHICDFVKTGEIVNIYLPAISGKEKRKTTFGAERILGVEGIDDKTIEEAIIKAGLTHSKTKEKGRLITNIDLFSAGLSGRQNSRLLREILCKNLNIPNLPTPSLLDALNTLFSYEEFLNEVEKCKQEEKGN